MDLALFDFDGTITTRETMPDFMRAAVPRSRLWTGTLLFSPLVIGYRFGVVSGTAIRAAICAYGFRGVPVATVESCGQAFARHVLPGLLRPDAMGRIAWHKARGDAVVVVSGGLDVYLEPWARSHDLGLVCSSLEQRGGLLTGRYRGRQCVRGEKARRVLDTYPPGNYARVHAYGDTSEDRELLAMAHERHYRWAPLDDWCPLTDPLP